MKKLVGTSLLGVMLSFGVTFLGSTQNAEAAYTCSLKVSGSTFSSVQLRRSKYCDRESNWSTKVFPYNNFLKTFLNKYLPKRNTMRSRKGKVVNIKADVYLGSRKLKTVNIKATLSGIGCVNDATWDSKSAKHAADCEKDKAFTAYLHWDVAAGGVTKTSRPASTAPSSGFSGNKRFNHYRYRNIRGKWVLGTSEIMCESHRKWWQRADGTVYARCQKANNVIMSNGKLISTYHIPHRQTALDLKPIIGYHPRQ